MQPIIKLTDAAAKRVKALMSQSEQPVLGLRIGVRSTGCSGLGYVMDYAKELRPHEEVVEDKDVRLYIEPTSIMYLIGVELDYVEDKLQSRFVFNNPNEKSRCGCGESFSV